MDCVPLPLDNDPRCPSKKVSHLLLLFPFPFLPGSPRKENTSAPASVPIPMRLPVVDFLVLSGKMAPSTMTKPKTVHRRIPAAPLVNP